MRISDWSSDVRSSDLDRGFVENDAASADVDDGVHGAEVDGDVIGVGRKAVEEAHGGGLGFHARKKAVAGRPRTHIDIHAGYVGGGEERKSARQAGRWVIEVGRAGNRTGSGRRRA